MKKINLNTLKEIISNNNQFIILTHQNPDGDTIGSSIALSCLLKKLNKKTYILCPDKIPKNLLWWKETKEIIVFDDEKNIKEIKTIFQLNLPLFCIDFNTTKQIKKFSEYFSKHKGLKILIDHHPNPENIFNFAICNTNVSSTAELLYTIIKKINLKNLIDKNFATGIYIGILWDTNSFSVNAYRKKTFQVTAELFNYGIDSEKIYNNIFCANSYNRLKFIGFLLHNRLQLIENYSTAYMWFTKEEFKKFDLQPGDTEFLVNIPLSIKNVNLSVLFYEKEDYIKISLRSKGKINVNRIARKYFNGGGHKNAAGGEERQLSLSETINKFLNLLEKIF